VIRDDIAAERLADLREWASTSQRSQQSELGWSEIGHSCSRYVWNRLHGVPSPNLTKQHVLAALRGTGVHAELEPFLETLGYQVEFEVEYGGIPGHVDAYRDGVVEDTKSALAEKVRSLRLHGPSQAWRTQVHGYARALAEKGHDVHTVRIVAYAIDSSDEITVWEEPYNPEIAERAVARVLELAEQTDPPEPGMDVSWCEKFCRFHGEGGCTGRTVGDGLPELDDPAVLAAVEGLREARADVKEANERKKAAEHALAGVAGIADGFAVTQVTVAPSEVPDDERIRDAYRFVIDDELPTKTKSGYSYVSVRKARS